MHAETFIELESDCGALIFDPSIGNLPSLRFRTDGNDILSAAHRRLGWYPRKLSQTLT